MNIPRHIILDILKGGNGSKIIRFPSNTTPKQSQTAYGMSAKNFRKRTRLIHDEGYDGPLPKR